MQTQRHRHVEIGTGLNYWAEDGKNPAGGSWRPTLEQWQPTAEGVAAVFGPHQVVLANDVGLGNCVQITGAGGTQLRGNPLAIGIFDPVNGKHVVVATVIAAAPHQGEQPNEIIFPQCFDGLKASLRYIYKKAGFSQEVILEEALALPPGFSAQSRLECYSEFDFTTMPPAKTARMLRAETGFADETLELGDLRIGAGWAKAAADAAFRWGNRMRSWRGVRC